MMEGKKRKQPRKDSDSDSDENKENIIDEIELIYEHLSKKAKILATKDSQGIPYIDKLPAPIITQVLFELNITELGYLCSISSKVKELCSESVNSVRFWMSILIADFGDFVDSDGKLAGDLTSMLSEKITDISKINLIKQLYLEFLTPSIITVAPDDLSAVSHEADNYAAGLSEFVERHTEKIEEMKTHKGIDLIKKFNTFEVLELDKFEHEYYTDEFLEWLIKKKDLPELGEVRDDLMVVIVTLSKILDLHELRSRYCIGSHFNFRQGPNNGIKQCGTLLGWSNIKHYIGGGIDEGGKQIADAIDKAYAYTNLMDRTGSSLNFWIRTCRLIDNLDKYPWSSDYALKLTGHTYPKSNIGNRIDIVPEKIKEIPKDFWNADIWNDGGEQASANVKILHDIIRMNLIFDIKFITGLEYINLIEQVDDNLITFIEDIKKSSLLVRLQDDLMEFEHRKQFIYGVFHAINDKQPTLNLNTKSKFFDNALCFIEVSDNPNITIKQYVKETAYVRSITVPCNLIRINAKNDEKTIIGHCLLKVRENYGEKDKNNKPLISFEIEYIYIKLKYLISTNAAQPLLSAVANPKARKAIFEKTYKYDEPRIRRGSLKKLSIFDSKDTSYYSDYQSILSIEKKAVLGSSFGKEGISIERIKVGESEAYVLCDNTNDCLYCEHHHESMEELSSHLKSKTKLKTLCPKCK
jgi:hypothetical protein